MKYLFTFMLALITFGAALAQASDPSETGTGFYSFTVNTGGNIVLTDGPYDSNVSTGVSHRVSVQRTFPFSGNGLQSQTAFVLTSGIGYFSYYNNSDKLLFPRPERSLILNAGLGFSTYLEPLSWRVMADVTYYWGFREFSPTLSVETFPVQFPFFGKNVQVGINGLAGYANSVYFLTLGFSFKRNF